MPREAAGEVVKENARPPLNQVFRSICFRPAEIRAASRTSAPAAATATTIPSDEANQDAELHIGLPDDRTAGGGDSGSGSR